MGLATNASNADPSIPGTGALLSLLDHFDFSSPDPGAGLPRPTQKRPERERRGAGTVRRTFLQLRSNFYKHLPRTALQ